MSAIELEEKEFKLFIKALRELKGVHDAECKHEVYCSESGITFCTAERRDLARKCERKKEFMKVVDKILSIVDK